MSGITLLGLGPGNPAQLTREAWQVLSSAREIWLRTRQHPVVAAFPGSLEIHSFDEFYENGESFNEVYEKISGQVIDLGRRDEGVLYAVPGHPFVAESTSNRIARLADEEGIPLRVVAGLSFLEPVFAAIQRDPFPQLTLCDAMELSVAHVLSFPPDRPVLIAQLYSRLVASEVKLALNTLYPDQHPVHLIHAAGTPEEVVEDLPLYQVDRSEHIGVLSSLYVPPLAKGYSLESFQEIVAHLRAPDGCPWDREQTHQTLRPHLLEETYECLAAIDQDDLDGMREEFGDLLLQIVLHAQIATEGGAFTLNEVIKQIYDKIVRRHPHVFGDLRLEGVSGVLQNWEKLKEQERNGKKEHKGLLDGVPGAFPALSQAQEYQDRAARVGFDWPLIEGVLDKIAEEILEIKEAPDGESLEGEIGDLFFVLVNLARWKGVDAESALRRTNRKFKERFGFIELHAREQGVSLSDMTLEQMDALWEQAKRLEAD